METDIVFIEEEKDLLLIVNAMRSHCFGFNVAIDVEATGLSPITSKLLLTAIKIEYDSTIYVIDNLKVPNLSLISREGNSRCCIWVGSNIKYDYKMLVAQASLQMDYTYDIEQVERRLFQGLNLSYSLLGTLRRRLPNVADLKKEVRSLFIDRDISIPFTQEEINYAAGDVDYLLPIMELQLDNLEEVGMSDFILNHYLNAISVLGDAEVRGVKHDTEKWLELSKANQIKADLASKLFSDLVVKYWGEDNLKGVNPTLEKEIDSYNRAIIREGDRYEKWTKEIEELKSLNKTQLKKYTNAEVSRDKAKLKLDKAKEDLVETTKGYKINLSSSMQIISVLNNIEFPVPTIYDKKERKRKPSVDKKLLNKWAEENKDSKYRNVEEWVELIEAYLEYKIYQHRVDSFGKSWADQCCYPTDEGNIIYSAFSAGFTVTGRLTSGDKKIRPRAPNYQQIPANDDFRHCTIARKGNKLMTIDWSGAELTIMIALSLDEDFKKISKEFPDLHSFFAQKCWRVIYKYRASKEKDKVEKERLLDIADTFIVNKESKYRKAFKAITFGVIYGMETSKLSKELKISIKEAELVIQAIKDTIPNTFKMVEYNTKKAFAKGYVTSSPLVGTRRHFQGMLEYLQTENLLANINIPDTDTETITKWFEELEPKIKDKDFKLWAEIFNKSRNYPIQGLQADALFVFFSLLKEFTVKLNLNKRADFDPRYQYESNNKTLCLMLLTIHDECVIELAEYLDVYLPPVIKKLMCEAPNKYFNGFITMDADYAVKDYWCK